MEISNSKDRALMNVVESLRNRALEDFRAEPITFDQSKVRDSGYDEQLQQMLRQIRQLFQFNSYFAFRKNKALYNRFAQLYEANLEDYQAKYLDSVSRYNEFKQKLSGHQTSIHPAHAAMIDLREIEGLLEAHDYEENDRAKALIADLSKKLDEYVAQFKSWQDQVAEFQTLIDEHKHQVWKEVIEKWQKRLDTYKKQLAGSQLPPQTIVLSQDEIDEAISQRRLDVETWLAKLTSDSKHRDEAEKFYSGSSTKARFTEFCEMVDAKTLKVQRRSRKLWTIYIGSLCSAIILTFVFFGLIKPIIDENSFWEDSVEMDSRSAYESYLYRYPAGEHVGEANEKLRFFEDELWKEAFNSGTTESYEYYVQEYPYGRYRDEATKYHEEILRQKEKDLWLASKKTNSIQSYQDYIDAYPDGRNVSEAIKLRDDLFLVYTFTIQTFVGPPSGITSVAFSPDGSFLLTGARDHGMKKWSVESGNSIGSFYGHSDDVTCIAISPDGKYAASGSSDNTIKYWELKYGRKLKSLEGHQQAISSLTFSPDGNYVISSSNDKTIRQWDISNGRPVKTYSKHEYNTGDIACSPDGNYVAFSGWAEVRLVELSTMRHKIYSEGEGSGYDQFVFSVDISPDNNTILSSGSKNQMVLYELSSGKILRRFPKQDSKIYSVSISSNGKYALSGSGDGILILWSLISGKRIRRFEAHDKVVTSVAFSPDGEFAISGSEDGTMKLWNLGL